MFTSGLIDENMIIHWWETLQQFFIWGQSPFLFLWPCKIDPIYSPDWFNIFNDGIYSRLVQNIQNWFNIFSCWKKKVDNMFLLCLETCVWACVDNSWWTKLVVIINTNCCLITWQYNIFVGLCLFSILRLSCQLARQISSAFFSLC